MISTTQSRSNTAVMRILALATVLLIFLASGAEAWAHNVAEGDKGYIQESSGTLILPFIYLGAKHMVTGYDHLLFLFGVIFFLYRLKDVGIYVTLFAIGHSTTLLFGVLTGITANAYLIDAIIGLSVVYKALDNLGAFQRWFGFQPSTKAATLIFGFFHGFGLATKIIEFEIAEAGLVPNLLAFPWRNPDRDGLLAQDRELHASRLRRQLSSHDRGLHARRLPTRRLRRSLITFFQEQ